MTKINSVGAKREAYRSSVERDRDTPNTKPLKENGTVQRPQRNMKSHYFAAAAQGAAQTGVVHVRFLCRVCQERPSVFPLADEFGQTIRNASGWCHECRPAQKADDPGLETEYAYRSRWSQPVSAAVAAAIAAEFDRNSVKPSLQELHEAEQRNLECSYDIALSNLRRQERILDDLERRLREGELEWRLPRSRRKFLYNLESLQESIQAQVLDVAAAESEFVRLANLRDS